MKKSEIALIVLIALVSFGIAWFVGDLLFKDPDDEFVKINYMNQIGTGLTQPNVENFNAYTPNPTVEIYIGTCPYGEEWDDELKICKKSEDFKIEEK